MHSNSNGPRQRWQRTNFSAASSIRWFLTVTPVHILPWDVIQIFLIATRPRQPPWPSPSPTTFSSSPATTSCTITGYPHSATRCVVVGGGFGQGVGAMGLVEAALDHHRQPDRRDRVGQHRVRR